MIGTAFAADGLARGRPDHAAAAVVFFLVIKPVNALLSSLRTEPPVDEETRRCPECLSEIPTGAKRCAFCTAQVAPA